MLGDTYKWLFKRSYSTFYNPWHLPPIFWSCFVSTVTWLMWRYGESSFFRIITYIPLDSVQMNLWNIKIIKMKYSSIHHSTHSYCVLSTKDWIPHVVASSNKGVFPTLTSTFVNQPWQQSWRSTTSTEWTSYSWCNLNVIDGLISSHAECQKFFPSGEISVRACSGPHFVLSFKYTEEASTTDRTAWP